MSPRIIRRLVLAVFVVGILGMIFGSVKNSNGLAVTAGLVTAIGAIGLILVTSVAPSGSLAKPTRAPATEGDRGDDEATPATRRAPDEAIARDVERRITDLVATGADEEQVRLLVRRAVDLGRGS